MHEMGIALQIIDIVQASIPGDIKTPKVTLIDIEIGSGSAIVPDSLIFCFEIASKETVCDGANLKLTRTDDMMGCHSCHHEFPVNNTVFECPACSSNQIRITRQTDIEIRSFEVDG